MINFRTVKGGSGHISEWDVPEPCPDFRAKVELAITKANIGADEIAPFPQFTKKKQVYGPGEIPRQGRNEIITSERPQKNRRCAGCNVPLDYFTRGCHNCSTRHAVRRYNARKRAEKAQLDTKSVLV